MTATLQSPRTVRQSLLAAYGSCPRRVLYDLQTNERSPSPLAAIGTVFHRFVHRCVEYMAAKQEREMPVEMGMEFLNGILAQVDVPDHEVVPLSMKSMATLRSLATKWCQEMSREILIDRLGGVEDRMSMEIEVPGRNGTTYSRTITGQIDVWMALGTTARILDHKSGWKRPVQPKAGKLTADGGQLSEEGWPQANIYSLLLMANRPAIERVEFWEWSVMWGEYRVRVVERYEMERLRDTVAATAAAFDASVASGPDSERWPAMAGPQCGMCAGARFCQTRRAAGIPASEVEALEAYTVWRRAAEQRTEAATALKVFHDANGPLLLPHGKMLGFDPRKPGRNFGEFDPRVEPKQSTPKKKAEPASDDIPWGDDVPF